MNKWIKIGTVLALLAIIGGGLTYKYIYNKPHRDFEKAEADYFVSYREVFNAYNNNRSDADKMYTGKVLEIEGILTGVETPDSLTILVFALTEGMFGEEGIRITMLPKYNEQAQALQTGDNIKVKGFCAGFNDTDVILEKGSITN